jgi:hypothetical protein
MREIGPVVVFSHLASHGHAVQCVALGGYGAGASGSLHVHGKVTVANVAFEACRERVGLEIVPVSEGVDHGVCNIFYIDVFPAVGAACV